MRLHGLLPLATLDEALTHYQYWLGQEEEREGEDTTFFDADHSLGGRGIQVQPPSRPQTPLLDGRSQMASDPVATRSGATGASADVGEGDLSSGPASQRDQSLKSVNPTSPGATAAQPEERDPPSPSKKRSYTSSLRQRFREFADRTTQLARSKSSQSVKSIQSIPDGTHSLSCEDELVVHRGATSSRGGSILAVAETTDTRGSQKADGTWLARSTIFSPNNECAQDFNGVQHPRGGPPLVQRHEQSFGRPPRGQKDNTKPWEEHSAHLSVNPTEWGTPPFDVIGGPPVEGGRKSSTQNQQEQYPGYPPNSNASLWPAPPGIPPVWTPPKKSRADLIRDNRHRFEGDRAGDSLARAVGEVIRNRGPPGPRPENSAEGLNISTMSLEELTRLVRSVISSEQSGRTHCRQTSFDPPKQDDKWDWQYEYAPRGRFHLIDLDKFSGDVETYPVFKQNLLLCLERIKLRDTKDKALFVFKYLSGNAKDLVTHLIRPLTDDSYDNVIRQLDKAYGRGQDLDRILIRKIFGLPRLTELNLDNLLHMSSVLEAAMPALLRKEPVDTLAVDGDKLNWVVNLLPQTERDLFRVHCKIMNQVPNLKGFLHFLDDKHEERACMLPFRLDRSQRKAQAEKKRLGKTSYLANMTEKDTARADCSSGEEDQEDRSARPTMKAEAASATPQKENRFGPCKCCEGPHDLGFCEKFKNLSLEKRRRIVDLAKACSSCLMVGHFARSCIRRKRCPQEGCNMRHHPLLHDPRVAKIMFFEETGNGFADLTECSDSETSLPPSPKHQ